MIKFTFKKDISTPPPLKISLFANFYPVFILQLTTILHIVHIFYKNSVDKYRHICYIIFSN